MLNLKIYKNKGENEQSYIFAMSNKTYKLNNIKLQKSKYQIKDLKIYFTKG